MAKFDRSKFKGSSVAKLKEQEEQTEKLAGTSNGGRAGYHEIDNGTNKFRIYPGQGDETFCLPKVTVWLPREVEEKDEKGKTKKVVKNMPVFNAKVHGGYEKDLVEEYVKFVTALLQDEIDDADELKTRLAILKNGKAPSTKISNDIKYVCYADKISTKPDKSIVKKFARLEFGKSIKDQINKQAFSEDSDDPIETDIISDPDNGFVVKIVRDPNAKTANDFYSVSLEVAKGAMPLTDEELEFLETQESLTSLLTNTFKRSDYENQLAGLQIYDEKHGFGAFAHDSWLDIVEEIDAMVPEDDEKKEPETKKVGAKSEKSSPKEEKKSTAKTPPPAKKKAKSGDMFDDMDRTELKEYIAEEELEILVKKSMSDDDIRSLIREEHLKDEEEEPAKKIVAEEEDDEEEEAPIKETPFKEEKKTAGESSKDKFAAMKAKLAASQKK